MKQTLQFIRIVFLLLASLVVLVNQSLPQNSVKEKRTHVQASQLVGIAMPAELEEEDLKENNHEIFRMFVLPTLFSFQSSSSREANKKPTDFQKEILGLGSNRLNLLCVYRI